MRILGISAFYHDSAAALVEDGRIIAAAQEERFTRKKHDASFPHNAVNYCLQVASAKLADIDRFAFYDKPFLKFERLLETYIALAPQGFRSFKMAMPLWLKEKLLQESLFELASDSPYELVVADVRKDKCRAMMAAEQALFGIDKLNISRSEIPAVTHIDYSPRVQSPATNPLFHRLLSRFKQLTGCPVLVNTSFNVRGEPIVCTPEDAFRCFMGNELDFLVVGNCVLKKAEQDPALKQDFSSAFDWTRAR